MVVCWILPMRACTRPRSRPLVRSNGRFHGALGLRRRRPLGAAFTAHIDQAIAHADSIIAIGLDSRFSFSIAGSRSAGPCARSHTGHGRFARLNLARYTEHWLRPSPGKEGAVLQLIVDSLLTGGGNVAARMAGEIGIDSAALERAIEAWRRGSHRHRARRRSPPIAGYAGCGTSAGRPGKRRSASVSGANADVLGMGARRVPSGARAAQVEAPLDDLPGRFAGALPRG
jgi:hypothetical protein